MHAPQRPTASARAVSGRTNREVDSNGHAGVGCYLAGQLPQLLHHVLQQTGRPLSLYATCLVTDARRHVQETAVVGVYRFCLVAHSDWAGRLSFSFHETHTWSRSSTRTAASCGLICCMRFRMAVAALRVFSASTRRSMPDCSRSSPPAAVDFLPLAAGFGSSSAGGEAQNSRMTSCSAAGGGAQLLPAMHCCNGQAWRKPLQRISHSVLQQSDRILLLRNEKNRGLRCMSSGPPECRRWPQFARWSHPRADRQRRCALALRGPPRLLL